MYKIDLHTHSSASPDGGITIDQYRKALSSQLLDFVAVTDHNSIDFALHLRDALGHQVIVGEEILTESGEIIGLFLSEVIAPNQSLKATIHAIKRQGGLVYIPHPFETVRQGLHPKDLDACISDIDIFEVVNGRAFLQNRSQQAAVYAKLNRIPGVASSDAHGFMGLGRTYTTVLKPIDQTNLVSQLAAGIPFTMRPSARALLYPKFNKLKKKLKK